MPAASTSKQIIAVGGRMHHMLHTRVVEAIMALLSVVSILLLAVEYLVDLKPAETVTLYGADFLIVAVLAVEFALRARRSTKVPSYLARHSWELLALLPAVAFVLLESDPLIGAGVRSLRLIRGIRVFVVVGRAGLLLRAFGEILQRSRFGVLLVLSLVTVVVGAVGVFSLEGHLLDSPVRGIEAALWWSLTTTLNSVDGVVEGTLLPVSGKGRLLGVALKFLGLAFTVAFITAVWAALVERRVVPRPGVDQSDLLRLVKARLDRLPHLTAAERETLPELVRTLCSRQPPSA